MNIGHDEHHPEGHNDEGIHSSLLHKMICLGIFFLITFLSGIMTINCKLSRNNKKILSYLNTVRGSVGMASAFFLILPIAASHFTEHFEKKDDVNSVVKKFPWSFAIALAVYTTSLVLLRIVFSLESTSEHSHNELAKDNEVNKKSLHQHKHESKEEEDAQEKNDEEEEEAFKNIVGSRGRFMTYMGIEKMRRSFSSQGKDLVVSRRSSIVRASLIISKQFRNDKAIEDKGISDDILSECGQNCKEVDLCDVCNQIELKVTHEDNENDQVHYHKRESKIEEPGHDHSHGNTKKSIAFAYLLLAIVAIHGICIGLTLGTLDHTADLLAFGMVMLAYKSIEQITLGVIFREALFEKHLILRQALLQALCIPVGIAIGAIAEPAVIGEAIFYSITGGVLLYQTASESIIEEFAFTTQRFTKFFIFLFTAIFVAFITCLTHLK